MFAEGRGPGDHGKEEADRDREKEGAALRTHSHAVTVYKDYTQPQLDFISWKP